AACRALRRPRRTRRGRRPKRRPRRAPFPLSAPPDRGRRRRGCWPERRGSRVRSSGRDLLRLPRPGGEKARLLLVQLGQLVANFFVHAPFGELDRAADGVADRPRRRAAVADETAPLDAEQRGGAVFGVVGAGAETVDRRFQNGVAQLGPAALADLLAEHPAEQLGERLGAL